MKSASAPSGWEGLDIDLLDVIAARLNFSYELHEMVPLTDETWGAMLLRLTPQADLVLSYCLAARISYPPRTLILFSRT